MVKHVLISLYKTKFNPSILIKTGGEGWGTEERRKRENKDTEVGH